MNAMLDVLLDASLRACLAAAGVGLALAAFRVRSAAARHAAWTALLGAMLLMAPLRGWVPAIPVPAPAAVAFPEPIAVDPLPQPAPAPVSVAPGVAAAPPPAAMPPPARDVSWTDVAFAAYLLGLALSVARLLFGGRAAREFARSCEPVDGVFYESPRAVTPVTAGLFRPRVVLPPDWRGWSATKLRAVLAHEAAHARRRDNMVNALALLNCAIFWFHPLAWWLRRELAALAETACDDAALVVAGDGRGYAAILLDLADSARRSGGRVLWQSGMHGGGSVERRIDRILQDRPVCSISIPRGAAFAIVCAASLLFAVACQRQTALAPLRDDPAEVAAAAHRKMQHDQFEAARLMTAEQATALEALIEKNPEDLESRRKLLYFYRWSGANVIGFEKTIAGRRRQILWLIEHHPESDLSGEAISASSADPLADPAGYAQAKRLWLDRVAKPGAGAKELANAALFFSAEDKQLAEKLLLRAKAEDPGRGLGSLGRLYYQALVGANSGMPQGVVRSVRLAEAHGAYANEVRRKLAASNDAELLASVGMLLTMGGPELVRSRLIDFDPLVLARQYLERALQLDPNSATAHRAMILLRFREQPLGWRTSPLDQRYAVIQKLPEEARFSALAQYAEGQYWSANNKEYEDRRPAAAKTDWNEANRAAQEALDLAAKYPKNPDYGAAFYSAHMTLGLVAMHDGDHKLAVKHLLAAAEAPSTEELAYSHQTGTYRLPAWLLKDGVREPVIQFLDRFSQTDLGEQKQLRDAAAQLRAGEKPIWYRY